MDRLCLRNVRGGVRRRLRTTRKEKRRGKLRPVLHSLRDEKYGRDKFTLSRLDV